MDDEFALPNFEDGLPAYFPVHLSLRINTDFAQVQLLSQIDAKLLAARKVGEAFLAHVSSNPHLLQDSHCAEFLDKQVAVFEKLLLAKYKLQSLQSTLKTAHRAFVDSRRQEQDLGLANYHVYKDVTKENFADKIIGDLDHGLGDELFRNILAADSSFQYLKNARYVLASPEDPLPDDLKDEDVAVAGGKLSLKDPLSLEYFVEPVLLRKCHHVYEKEHIARLLQGHAQINCPVTGCSAQLASNDLREDKLMALRVKVYLARTRRREQSLVVRI